MLLELPSADDAAEWAVLRVAFRLGLDRMLIGDDLNADADAAAAFAPDEDPEVGAIAIVLLG